MITKKCLICDKEFRIRGEIRKLTGKYCSNKCRGQSLIGKPTWNKGTKGICKPNSGSFKKGIHLGYGFKKGHNTWNKGLVGYMAGEKNANWGGGKSDFICDNCGKSFKEYLINRSHLLKFCSYRCMGEYQSKTRIDENSANWKGDDVGYTGIHAWVRKHRGAPTKCEYCGKDGLAEHKIHWANTDHKWKRNLDDYIRLCRKCHFDYDLKNNLIENIFYKRTV